MEGVMNRRNFMRVLGASGVIVAGAGLGLTQCDPMPAEAIVAWTGPDGTITDPRARAIAYALLAPNPHNRQPWIVDLREQNAATLYCDNTRLLPETDPASRQITIGCGAFLELFQMAAAAEGHVTSVTLFPAGGWPEGKIGDTPIARIEFQRGDALKSPLFDQVLKRRTNRGEYSGPALSPDEAMGMAAAIQDLPVQFGWSAEAGALAQLKDIAKTAWRIEADTDRTYLESVNLFRITGSEIAQHRDGLSMHGPFFWWMNRAGLFTREKALDAFNREQARTTFDGPIDSTPSFAWLTTAANDRAAQIAAGRAYLRASLKAAELGLSQQPLSQALQEFPEMAGPYAQIKTALGVSPEHTVQMFCRIGHGRDPGPSPRRAVSDIFRT
jgi:hypothetical protein